RRGAEELARFHAISRGGQGDQPAHRETSRTDRRHAGHEELVRNSGRGAQSAAPADSPEPGGSGEFHAAHAHLPGLLPRVAAQRADRRKSRGCGTEENAGGRDRSRGDRCVCGQGLLESRRGKDAVSGDGGGARPGGRGFCRADRESEPAGLKGEVRLLRPSLFKAKSLLARSRRCVCVAKREGRPNFLVLNLGKFLHPKRNVFTLLLWSDILQKSPLDAFSG